MTAAVRSGGRRKTGTQAPGDRPEALPLSRAGQPSLLRPVQDSVQPCERCWSRFTDEGSWAERLYPLGSSQPSLAVRSSLHDCGRGQTLGCGSPQAVGCGLGECLARGLSGQNQRPEAEDRATR